MSPVLNTALIVSEILLTISILIAFYRLVKGPTVVDRIIAFDLIALTIVAFAAVLSIQQNTPHFIELLLVISLVGFFGTVALVSIFDLTPKENENDE